MVKLPDSGSVLDVHYGVDPALDALLLHFTTENNIEYFTDPQENAPPEQVRFIVALDENAFYAPCSDWMFWQLLRSQPSHELFLEYLRQWRTVVDLARERVADPYLRRRIIALLRHKFRLALGNCIFIPSRLLKRMLTIFMAQSGLDDPSRESRQRRNLQAAGVLGARAWDRALNVCPAEQFACQRLGDLRFELDFLEFRRLVCLSAMQLTLAAADPETACAQAVAECEAEAGAFEPLRGLLGFGEQSLRILFLPEGSGNILFDAELLRCLIRQGHRVVLALKEGFYFDAPLFWDPEHDPELARALHGARFVPEVRVSKNELLRAMAESPLLVISDGTRERFNPYRTSVTFARAWKEADLVIAKGEEHYRRLVQTSHEFTRDILCYFRDQSGHLHLHFKPKAEWVRKFSESDIRAKAEAIIEGMRRARSEGRTVMFYSAIIGSIPGQVKVAVEVVTTFVEYLRTRLENAYIINPGEHFEEGMDADDLMYMWEKVQRSGFINVWRFQSTQDIEKSFELLGRKVPPVWAGKDATYSTGCTKEMHIALDLQKKTPELQIIGPNPEQFFRRREYGVGKFCDVAVDDCGA
ncbi:MAG: hypothetical protein AB7D57_09670 [Desulfovibrionaceae bacterium]